MKIRFKEKVEVEFITDVCCFSGRSDRRKQTMNIGDVLKVTEVSAIPSRWSNAMTQKGRARQWKHVLTLDNDKKNTLHPDTVNDVPPGSFEIVDEQREERKLIHSEWWGKCRSCVFWKG